MIKAEEFFSEIYKDNDLRVDNKRDIAADIRQWEVNRSHFAEEKQLEAKFGEQQTNQKMIFIVGVPRSGTTLLAQLLMQNFELGTFFNALAKYYSVPLFGMKKIIQNKGKIAQKENHFKSFLGHTEGEYAPHEFGYFWQYWLNHQGHDELNSEQLKKVQWNNLAKKLNGLCNLLKNDLLIKSIVYNNFIIKKLAAIFPTAQFIYIKRNFVFVVQSIIEARIRQYGSEEVWWSIRPKQYESWQKLSVEDQVAKQVVYISKQIEEQLSVLSEDRVLEISYEDLTKNYDMNEISSFLGNTKTAYKDDLLLKNRNQIRFKNLRITKIQEAISKAENYYGYKER